MLGHPPPPHIVLLLLLLRVQQLQAGTSVRVLTARGGHVWRNLGPTRVSVFADMPFRPVMGLVLVSAGVCFLLYLEVLSVCVCVRLACFHFSFFIVRKRLHVRSNMMWTYMHAYPASPRPDVAECEFDSKNECDLSKSTCVEEEGSYSCDCLAGYEHPSDIDIGDVANQICNGT